MSLKVATYQEAKDRAARYQAKRREKVKARTLKPATAPLRAKRKALRAKPDRKLAEWSRKVKERDGHQCQWPGIADYIADAPADFKISIKLAMAPCLTRDGRIDAHHIAERSLRPDLKYDVSNGVALCRTHHDWLPLNREAAVAIGMLSDETYEKARKAA